MYLLWWGFISDIIWEETSHGGSCWGGDRENVIAEASKSHSLDAN